MSKFHDNDICVCIFWSDPYNLYNTWLIESYDLAQNLLISYCSAEAISFF